MRTEIFMIDGYAIELVEPFLLKSFHDDESDFCEGDWSRPLKSSSIKELVFVPHSEEEEHSIDAFCDQDLIGNAIDFNCY